MHLALVLLVALAIAAWTHGNPGGGSSDFLTGVNGSDILTTGGGDPLTAT